MTRTYSVYEAKAKFSEIISRIRDGQRVIISYRGKDVAEIRPLEQGRRDLADSLTQLEEEGILSPASHRLSDLAPLARVPGALSRFLESRE